MSTAVVRSLTYPGVPDESVAKKLAVKSLIDYDIIYLFAVFLYKPIVMQDALNKSESSGAKSKKKKAKPDMPKTPGGRAVLGMMGIMKEAQEREKKRLPK